MLKAWVLDDSMMMKTILSGKCQFTCLPPTGLSTKSGQHENPSRGKLSTDGKGVKRLLKTTWLMHPLEALVTHRSLIPDTKCRLLSSLFIKGQLRTWRTLRDNFVRCREVIYWDVRVLIQRGELVFTLVAKQVYKEKIRNSNTLNFPRIKETPSTASIQV